MDDPGPSVDQSADDDAAAEPAPRKHRPRPYPAAPRDDIAPAKEPAGAPPKEPAGEPPQEPAGARHREAAGNPARPAGQHSDNTPRSVRSGLSRYVRGAAKLGVAVVVAVVAALLLRSYVVAPYFVPSQSMEPTLHGCPHCNDDHVLVEKLSYHFHAVQSGDIVVFDRPPNWHVSDKVLIKRVIGVAGDRIKLRNGHVYRNGQRLDEPYVNPQCKQGTTTENGSTAAHAYPRVKSGEVFVMGDNRCDSADSRFFGDVPTSDIVGRAFMIVWPVKRIHTLN